MIRNLVIFGFLSVLWAVPSNSSAIPEFPARIGGTVTVGGEQLTSKTDKGYVFEVRRQDGSSYIPVAEDKNGLNNYQWYVIDVQIYDGKTQPGGAKPGQTAVIHVYKDSVELQIVDPSNGKFLIGEKGSRRVINLKILNSEPTTNKNTTDLTKLKNK